MKLRAWMIGVIAIVVSATGGCAGTDAPGERPVVQQTTTCPEDEGTGYRRPEVAASGNVTVAVEEPMSDYNNNTATANNFANSHMSLVQPSAFFIDHELSVCVDTDLLESVEKLSDDPLAITYKIRPDAVWSDGEPVGCKDFYLAWLAANSTATNADGGPAFDPAGTTGYDQMEPPQCSADDKTVTTQYTKPFADWKGLFSGLLPAHRLEAASGVADLTRIEADHQSQQVRDLAQLYIERFSGFDPEFALSAGPYELESMSSEQSVLVRNEAWWGAAPGPESLTLVTNSDGQSQVQALQNQEVQVIQPQPDAALADQLRDSNGVIFNAYAGVTFEHIDFNLKLPLFSGEHGTALRQAVAYCVDRTDIVDKLVKGVNPDTEVLGSLAFMPTEDSYQDLYADYADSDIDRAKRVLEEDGWTFNDDGVYVIDGRRAEFDLGFKTIDNRQRIGQLVQASCAEAGIKINLDQDVIFNDERLPAGDFDAALFAWVGTPFKASTTTVYLSNGGANYNAYANPEVDRFLVEANSSPDSDQANQAWQEVDRLMAEDVHSIPLYQFSDMVAQVDTISPELTYNGVFGGVFWNAFEWTVQN